MGDDASEYGSLLANTDRTASDSLVFELQPPPEPEPEPETQPLQRTASTEALIEALHARGFSAVERTSYVNRGGEKLRFSAVDREALDRELGSAATESAPDPELGGEEGDPAGFRFSRCTTEFYHGTSLEAALNIQDEGFCVDLSGSNAGKMLVDEQAAAAVDYQATVDEQAAAAVDYQATVDQKAAARRRGI